MAKTTIDQIMKPVSRFINQEFTGSIILLAGVIAAISWINSPWENSYNQIWENHLSVGFAGFNFDHPLHVWINDGLMALFFFVIGLELKREFIAGELSTIRKAALPMVAALGGMAVPAVIFALFNVGLPSSRGWGIPMATDIAFAIGLLSLAGRNIPSSVKVFLSALAVADDLGAILVIALFYTGQVTYFPLLIAFALLLFLWAGNLLGVRSTAFYLIVGIVIWYFFLLSGVHATIAGVLVAFTIPARTKIDETEYLASLRGYAHKFQAAIPQAGTLTTEEQHRTIEKIKGLSLDAETPLQKIEFALHPWVAFVIMPLFALANAGMHIGEDFFPLLGNPISLGVSLGLVIGKFTGVFAATWLMVWSGFSVLPSGASWKHIVGVSLLAGVGFTMSLFVTGLAFMDPAMVTEAKYGILLASLFSGTAGILFLRSIPAPNR